MKYGLIVGIAVWLAAAWLFRLPLEAMILLFAPLVLVRPAIGLIEAACGEEPVRRFVRQASWLQFPAAVALAASFAVPQGLLAAALALPWLLVTLMLAVAGGLRLWRRGCRVDGDLAIGAALMLIAVGGGWAALSRVGLRPQGFSHTIVLLTAVHFHYAGFVLPLLAGLTANSLNRGRMPGRVDRLVLLSIVAGVPLVGVGISLSPQIEVVATMVVALGCGIFAVRQVQAAMKTPDPARITLLAISSLALISAMIPAAAYAWGEFASTAWLDIPTMIRTHGAFNAFGFAACGIAGHAIGRETTTDH
jgi:hypothetical protein